MGNGDKDKNIDNGTGLRRAGGKENDKGNEKEILVTGHRNPDTDSICAAISYSRLKNKMTASTRYVPCRAGEPNAETSFVLDYFKAEKPRLLKTVRTQARDLPYERMSGIKKDMSLKNAWNIMNREKVVTLAAVTESGLLEGLISESDITKSYMNVYDSQIISKARTRYRSIVETLEATLLIGDEDRYCDKGKVLIAAASPELMSYYIEKHDIVILGNRTESQLVALDKEADCIIICEGADASPTIRRLAEQNGMIIMVTSYDAYTAARLINQSMPVSYFMKTADLTVFRENDFLEDISDVMASKRYREFPVLSQEGHYLGLLSRRNLLGNHGKQVILVDHNEAGQAVDGIETANILEIIDHHRLGTIQTLGPVYFRNQPVGCTNTIIYKMYQEYDIDIDPQTAGLMMSAIVSDTLLFRSPTCTPLDEKAARSLAEIAGVDIEEYAMEMFSAGSNLKGKTEEQIFHQDFKRFKAGKISFGVSQITSLNARELYNMKAGLLKYAKSAVKVENLDMTFIMLTNILDQETLLLGAGKDAGKLIEAAFSVECEREGLEEGTEEARAKGEGAMEEGSGAETVKTEAVSAVLKNVVSRKKQLVPFLSLSAEQL